LTLNQTGTLFGVSAQKLDLEARFVITVDGQSVQVHVGTKEHRSAVVCGVDDKHHAEVTRALHMIEHLMIEHDSVIFRLNFGKACEVVPMHLAVVGLGTAWPWALRSLVKIA